MAARHADLFTISSASDIEEFERLLADDAPDTPDSITIDIPDGATTFFNARDFRRLLYAARAAETELQVRTDDPLRRELARIIGIRVAQPNGCPGEAHPAPIVSPNGPTHRVVPIVSTSAEKDDPKPAAVAVDDEITSPSATSDQLTTNSPLQPRPHPAGDDIDSDIDDEESEASFSFVICPPVPRRSQLFSDSVTARVATDDRYINEPITRLRAPQAKARSASPTQARARRRLVGFLVIVMTLVALAAVAFGLVLPSASITVTPLVAPIESTLTYGLDVPGATWDIRLAPQPISTTLTFSASGPTSGERFEPDGTASGAVQLTNATTVDVIVAEGTSLASEGGIDIVTAEEIVVPAADPYGSLTFGSASVLVRAALAGPEGNLPAETVYGQLDNGIFYTNHEPLAGGSSKRIATVAQADLDALQHQARINLDAQASVALSSILGPDQQLVNGSERRGAIQVSFDRQVGEDATSIGINATMTVSGQAFDPSEWHADALREAEQRLATLVGEGRELVDGSVVLSEPQPITDENTGYTVQASARVRSVVDAARLQALRPEVAGESADETVARIRQVSGVEGVTIDQENDWLTDDLPRLSSRITIEVVDAEGQGVSP